MQRASPAFGWEKGVLVSRGWLSGKRGISALPSVLLVGAYSMSTEGFRGLHDYVDWGPPESTQRCKTNKSELGNARGRCLTDPHQLRRLLSVRTIRRFVDLPRRRLHALS